LNYWSELSGFPSSYQKETLWIIIAVQASKLQLIINKYYKPCSKGEYFFFLLAPKQSN